MRISGDETRRVLRKPVDEDGLVGTLFYPSEKPSPLPTVIILGGSDGGLQENGAEMIASQGFSALALAYFGVAPLPKELVEIPLEYFERAIAWLRSSQTDIVDVDKIAVLGSSKGSELALLLGASFPKEIKAVVGYAPSGIVWQGISQKPKSYLGEPRSSWSFKDAPVPFIEYSRPRLKETVELFGSFLGRPAALSPLYERALGDRVAVERAFIAVERINGPVLLISGTDDRLWPSYLLSKMVMERLEAHNHPYDDEHLSYERAGHAITIPGSTSNTPSSGRFGLGGSEATNRRASEDAWGKVLVFLKGRFGL